LIETQKKIRSKGKLKVFNFRPILIFLGVLGIAMTIYIGYQSSISDKKLFSISLLALFTGLIFESFRISDNRKKVILIFVGSYFFSLINFLPSIIDPNHNFDKYIERWPYIFVVIFAFGFAIFNVDKVTTKITEGITLQLSISLIYWTSDYDFNNYSKWYEIVLLIIGISFTIFSLLNAFTNLKLTATTRLSLSIWSTIIMFAFAVANIFRIFNNGDIENNINLSQSLYIGIQYFLLGASAIYIVQNYVLLASFLPRKNENYQNDLKVIMKQHADRFSEEQVFINHSLFCILYSVTLYGLNYTCQILPRDTMIWFVFMTFPLILQLTERINKIKILK
jgi:hypothetical protein